MENKNGYNALYNFKYTAMIISILIFFIAEIKPLLSAEIVSDTWANVERYIAIHPGMSKSVWETADRSLITNGRQKMTARGDGTYEYSVDLTPGASYNYIFWAKTGATPPPGLQADNYYIDCIPTGGNIACGTAPMKIINWRISDTQSAEAYAHYGSVEWYDNGNRNFDARRILYVPSTLNEGDSMFIYNNFGDKPSPVTNFTASAIDTTTIQLNWQSPYGYWGSGNESFKAADVIAGGSYKILSNTTGSTNVYTVIATVPGNVYSYTHKNLTQNTPYYYAIVALDAYSGGLWDSFPQLSDTTAQDSATPGQSVKVRLRVDGFDWDYVKKNQQIVYFRNEEDPVFTSNKIKGCIARLRKE